MSPGETEGGGSEIPSHSAAKRVPKRKNEIPDDFDERAKANSQR
jgi:hypothetical protein